MPTRRFPPPWSVEELDAYFVVTDTAVHFPVTPVTSPLRIIM
jgi:hypothetical protein